MSVPNCPAGGTNVAVTVSFAVITQLSANTVGELGVSPKFIGDPDEELQKAVVSLKYAVYEPGPPEEKVLQVNFIATCTLAGLLIGMVPEVTEIGLALDVNEAEPVVNVHPELVVYPADPDAKL